MVEPFNDRIPIIEEGTTQAHRGFFQYLTQIEDAVNSISSGPTIRTITTVTEGDTYFIKPDDQIVIINKTVYIGQTNVKLPVIGQTGRSILVKDGKGNAPDHSILIIAESGEFIDGVPFIAISTTYSSIEFTDNGTEWSITGSS